MVDRTRCNPELRSFLLSNVRPTGIIVGSGAYGCVERVMMNGAVCAAKKIHEIFQDRSEIQQEDIERATEEFVLECKLMSTLRHPHIVQFMGVYFFPNMRLPALVMEMLVSSLHDMLVSDTTDESRIELYVPLGLKRSILQDVARGLDFLHHLSPPVIHRDLSARNVLLTSGMVAKIADLGVARRVVPQLHTPATMTKAPGASVYMPPEAVETKSIKAGMEKSKYDSSLDIFSLGVIAIFALSQKFPCDVLAATYIDKDGILRARSEIERREEYLEIIYKEVGEDHLLVQLIGQCLHNDPAKRPNINEVQKLLELAKAEVGEDEEIEMNKLELMQRLKVRKI